MRLAVAVVVHVLVEAVHAPAVRVGSPVRRDCPPAAVVTDTAERCAIVVATGQGGKTIGVRAGIGFPPQGAVGLEFCTCRSRTHIGFQRIPRRGVRQMPACGASGQGGGVVVQTAVGGTVASLIVITPTIATRWGVVQVLRHPSLGADRHGFVGLLSTGQVFCRGTIGAGLRIGGNDCG